MVIGFAKSIGEKRLVDITRRGWSFFILEYHAHIAPTLGKYGFTRMIVENIISIDFPH